MHTALGIVLRSFDYKENSRILSLFTKEQGLISLISRKAQPNLTTPLCYGEFLYHKGRGDLFSLREGKILSMHLPLRSSFDYLQMANKMLQALLTSQLPEKPAPLLFDLLRTYLAHLPENPHAIVASFLLKILKHEGLLQLTPHATILHDLQSANSFEALTKIDVYDDAFEVAEATFKEKIQ